MWLDAWRALLGASDAEGLLKWDKTFLGSSPPAFGEDNAQDLDSLTSLVLCSGKDAQAEQFKACPAVHGTLDEPEAMDLSFDMPIAPRLFEGSEEGCSRHRCFANPANVLVLAIRYHSSHAAASRSRIMRKNSRADLAKAAISGDRRSSSSRKGCASASLTFWKIAGPEPTARGFSTQAKFPTDFSLQQPLAEIFHDEFIAIQTLLAVVTLRLLRARSRRLRLACCLGSFRCWLRGGYGLGHVVQ